MYHEKLRRYSHRVCAPMFSVDTASRNSEMEDANGSMTPGIIRNLCEVSLYYDFRSHPIKFHHIAVKNLRAHNFDKLAYKSFFFFLRFSRLFPLLEKNYIIHLRADVGKSWQNARMKQDFVT